MNEVVAAVILVALGLVLAALLWLVWEMVWWLIKKTWRDEPR